MSKKESNVAETAGKRRPMEDSEAEGIVGGTGSTTQPPDPSEIPDGARHASGGDPRDIPEEFTQ